MTVSLRPATRDDESRLLAWRNEASVRAASLTTDPVTPAEHRSWLTRKLDDPKCLLFIVEKRGEPIGQVRLDILNSRTAEISVALEAASRGRGLGPQVINLAVSKAPADIRVIRALVKRENVASLRAFASAGFVVDVEREGIVRLAYAPTASEPLDE